MSKISLNFRFSLFDLRVFFYLTHVGLRAQLFYRLLSFGPVQTFCPIDCTHKPSDAKSFKHLLIATRHLPAVACS